MECRKTEPLVSVAVITYNSSNTVLETLNSIAGQTYQNLELIVSDDCSTDNTVEICREWVKQNKCRFARTEIITVERNTGTSGNLNRAEDACRGVWVKSVAGDDVFMPNCIQDCMDYVSGHQDTIYLFGCCKVFGADDSYCAKIDKQFDYSFFSLSQEQQLHRLLFDGNCIPAPTVFYHRERAKSLGIKKDERIPLLEDWPQWVNLLRAGVKFHFVNKILVKYRVNGLSTGIRASLPMFKSDRLFQFYYRFPEWMKEDKEKAIQRMVDDECRVYQMLLESETDTQTSLRQERNRYKEQYEIYYKWYNQIQHSKAYQLGKTILKPLKWIGKL